MKRTAQYYYFKPTGKWKYNGEGVSIPSSEYNLDHAKLHRMNGDSFPGINANLEGGQYYTIVIIDEHSYPRMILATRIWD